jgi:hypothetical protein
MAELEIHHEAGHEADPMGKKVGIQAAILAVMLAIVTISSHRTHTAAIIDKSRSNDQWAYYQATRIKLHSTELGETLVSTFGPKSAAAEKIIVGYEASKKKYEEQSKGIKEEAEGLEKSAEADEHRALRFDFGEGLLEIGLILSSLYFIARKNMFPLLGLIAAIAGIGIAVTGFLI